VVPGLLRLKAGFIIAPLSNGNVSLMIDLSKRAGLPWDALLGAEVVRAYKPMPQAYLGTAALLDMRPSEICLVAAHESDLAAARACGLRTCFMPRPEEHGPAGLVTDPAPAGEWDLVAADCLALATRLGT
jgi:2-haloacid dehalogenase